MANKFFVAPSPHVHSAQSTRSIMRDVLIAMLPALAVSTWVHGVDVLAVSAIAVVSCVVIEFLIQKFLFHGECTVSNLSAAVTGLLLALNLPPNIPLNICGSTTNMSEGPEAFIASSAAVPPPVTENMEGMTMSAAKIANKVSHREICRPEL